jgi:hypothetical protein
MTTIEGKGTNNYSRSLRDDNKKNKGKSLMPGDDDDGLGTEHDW